MGNQLSPKQWEQIKTLYPEDVSKIKPVILNINSWQLAEYWHILKKKGYTINPNKDNPLIAILEWAKEATNGAFFAKREGNHKVVFYFLEDEDEFLFKITWNGSI